MEGSEGIAQAPHRRRHSTSARGEVAERSGSHGNLSLNFVKDPEALLEGWLKKRGTRIPAWSERYFVLKGDQLIYYLKQGDADPRGMYILDPTVVLSEIKTHTSSYDKKKVLYAFRLLWPEAVELVEVPGDGVEGTAAAVPAVETPTTQSRARLSTEGYVLHGSPPRHSVSGPSSLEANGGSGRNLLDGQAAVPTKIIRSAYSPYQSSSSSSRTSNSSSSITRRPSGGNSVVTGAAMVGLAVGGVVVGALTAGVGLVAPMVIVGITAAAGSGATVYGVSQTTKTKQVSLVLASESKDLAEEWRAALEAQIKWSRVMPTSQLMSMVGLDRRNALNLRLKTPMLTKPTAATKIDDVDRWTRTARWKPSALYKGLRVYELDLDHIKTKGARPPCKRLQVPVRATPLETFIALVSIPSRAVNSVIDSTQIVERIDDQSDVIHISYRPIFMAPSWTAPRDFCLVRYWRYDDDGTYIVCYDSIQHRGCPPVRGYVRGDMHAVFTISPKKNVRNVEYDDSPECLLTYILQVNPGGWVWNSMGYVDTFACEVLLQALDIRDLLETDRFTAVHVDTSEDKAGGKEVAPVGNQSTTIETHKATLPPEMYAEIDAANFVVRGPTYTTDRVKVPSEKAAFRLLAVDLFDLAEPMDNIASHPKNRVQAAIKKGDCPPFVWVLQLQFPGPERHFGYVCYFAPDDMSIFEEDTPLSRVLVPFFRGDDDGYRDVRFKLIPKIVEGNWVVRKSVGSTPAILGTKLKQNYYKGKNYFELDVNIASSSVAAGVVRLAAGYAKTLVVDLALVIQGETANELPERVVACWRIKFMDLGCAKPLE